MFQLANRQKSKWVGWIRPTILLTGMVMFYALLPAGCKNNVNTPAPVAYGNNENAGKFADINGAKIYYEIYGEGEPLVILHGNGASISAGREQIAFFSHRFKVIAVDSRGQGKSSDNSDSLTYEAMAADLNALLNELKVDSAYLIGHSDGGITGLVTALRYPAKIKMLAAMAPNTRPDSAVLYPAVEADALAKLALYEDSVKNGQSKVTPALKLLRLMQYHPHIPATDLANIKAPVLLLSGDRDVIRLSHIVEIFSALPAAQLCVLPGSTHQAPRKNAAVYNETIHHFFNRPFQMPNSF